MNRTGEYDTPPERTRRFFKNEGYWYYATREGIDIGPFDSLSEAEEGLCAYIDFMMHAEPEVVSNISKYRCEQTPAAFA